MLLASTGGLSDQPRFGFSCSLGVAAAYRTLAWAHSSSGRSAVEMALPNGVSLLRRSYQVALRFHHLANVWVTHVWEKFARREGEGGWAHYEESYIDDSAWPIGIRQLNMEMTHIQRTLEDTGNGKATGHRPRWVDAPPSYRDRKLRLGITSLCAYPEGHPLPRLAASNHQAYAARHGYKYVLETEKLATERPPAWGKILLLQRLLQTEDEIDWWLWFDCDTFVMNMTVTLDSLLHRYCRRAGSTEAAAALDPSIHMVVAEDGAMLNSGTFLLRNSDWSKAFLQRVWGPKDSVWTEHPWWENAAIIWDLLRPNSEKFRAGAAGPEDWSRDDTEGIYPREVRLMPQFEFNSYHIATAGRVHDKWTPGKFALAFNGVLSNTSPNIVKVLYGNYYQLACELNGLVETGECLQLDEFMPWLQTGTSRNGTYTLS